MRLSIHALLGALAVLSSASLAPRARGEVTVRTLSPYPTPITNNAVTSVCTDGRCTIYSFMGMTRPTDPQSITAASYKLSSPGTGPWIPMADAPRLHGLAKIAASAATCSGKVYLIGGYTVDGREETTEHRLFRYDPKNDRYVRLADVPIPVDDTVVGVYRDRYIYLISGWHGPKHANTQAVQVYDTKTDAWRQATPIPTAGRFGHAGGLVDNVLVMIDGCASTPGYPIQHDTWIGRIAPDDPTVVTWQSAPPSPFRPTYRAAGALTVRLDWPKKTRTVSPIVTKDTKEASTRTLEPAPFRSGIIFVGGTDNAYNFNGTGYDGRPAQPLEQITRFDPIGAQWTRLDGRRNDGNPRANSTNARSVVPNAASTANAHSSPPPTMDHRGLVWFDGAWVTVGGMTGPGTATTLVKAFKPTPQ